METTDLEQVEKKNILQISGTRIYLNMSKKSIQNKGTQGCVFILFIAFLKILIS